MAGPKDPTIANMTAKEIAIAYASIFVLCLVVLAIGAVAGCDPEIERCIKIF